MGEGRGCSRRPGCATARDHCSGVLPARYRPIRSVGRPDRPVDRARPIAVRRTRPGAGRTAPRTVLLSTRLGHPRQGDLHGAPAPAAPATQAEPDPSADPDPQGDPPPPGDPDPSGDPHPGPPVPLRHPGSDGLRRRCSADRPPAPGRCPLMTARWNLTACRRVAAEVSQPCRDGLPACCPGCPRGRP